MEDVIFEIGILGLVDAVNAKIQSVHREVRYQVNDFGRPLWPKLTPFFAYLKFLSKPNLV